MTKDEEHKLRNYLTMLQMKAQLLGQLPIDQLNLKDTQEKIAIGFLRAVIEASEAFDRLEKALEEVENQKRHRPWERIKAWLSRFIS